MGKPGEDPATGAVGLRLRPIAVQGRLTITRGEHRLEVSATGDKIVVDAADFDTLQMLLKLRPPGETDGGGDTADGNRGKLQHLLKQTNLDLEVRCQGDLIARIGADAEPGWLEKVLQIKGVDISARGLIKSWFKS